MRRVYLLFASRAYIVFLSRDLGSTLDSGAHARPSTPLNREFSSISSNSCSFFFFSCCQLTIHSRALRLSVCCELQAALFSCCQLTIHSRALRLSVWCELQAAGEKKSDSPTSGVFMVVTVYPHGERMFEKACANPRRESYTSGSRTPSAA